jgi:hypothetical protein
MRNTLDFGTLDPNHAHKSASAAAKDRFRYAVATARIALYPDTLGATISNSHLAEAVIDDPFFMELVTEGLASVYANLNGPSAEAALTKAVADATAALGDPTSEGFEARLAHLNSKVKALKDRGETVAAIHALLYDGVASAAA